MFRHVSGVEHCIEFQHQLFEVDAKVRTRAAPIVEQTLAMGIRHDPLAIAMQQVAAACFEVREIQDDRWLRPIRNTIDAQPRLEPECSTRWLPTRVSEELFATGQGIGHSEDRGLINPFDRECAIGIVRPTAQLRPIAFENRDAARQRPAPPVLSAEPKANGVFEEVLRGVPGASFQRRAPA